MANNRELSQFANVVGYNGGNIGIGNTIPVSKLTVGDNTTNATAISISSPFATAKYGDLVFTTLGTTTYNARIRATVPGNGTRELSFITAKNASENTVMTLDGDGQVGIGTNNPALRAHIFSTANADAALIESTQNFATLRFKSALNTSGPTIGIDGAGGFQLDQKDTSKYIAFAIGSERLRITSTGEIQIKARSAGVRRIILSGSPSNSAFNIEAHDGATGASSGDVQGKLGLFYNDGSTLTNTANISFERGSGAADGAMVFVTNQTERLRITSGGNVGINESSPGGLLQVGASSGSHVIITPNTGIDVNDGAINLYQATTNVNAVPFVISSDVGGTETEKLRFTAGGKLGIGTNSPDYDLHVYGGGDILIEDNNNGSAHLRLRSSNGGTDVSNWKIKTGSNNFLYIENDTAGGTSQFTIDNTGKFGINDTTPSVSLDLASNTDALSLPTGTTAQRPTGTDAYIRKNSTNNALEFYNGTEWVEIITDYFPTGSTILG